MRWFIEWCHSQFCIARVSTYFIAVFFWDYQKIDPYSLTKSNLKNYDAARWGKIVGPKKPSMKVHQYEIKHRRTIVTLGTCPFGRGALARTARLVSYLTFCCHCIFDNFPHTNPVLCYITCQYSVETRHGRYWEDLVRFLPMGDMPLRGQLFRLSWAVYYHLRGFSLIWLINVVGIRSASITMVVFWTLSYTLRTILEDIYNAMLLAGVIGVSVKFDSSPARVFGLDRIAASQEVLVKTLALVGKAGEVSPVVPRVCAPCDYF